MDLQDKAIFFLGLFLGTASQTKYRGIYGEDWEELCKIACDCADRGPLSWMKKAEPVVEAPAPTPIGEDEIPF